MNYSTTENATDGSCDDVWQDPYEVLSTADLLMMGYISESDMDELMEPLTVAAVE